MLHVPRLPVLRAKTQNPHGAVPSLEAMEVAFQAVDLRGREQRVPEAHVCPREGSLRWEMEQPFQEALQPQDVHRKRLSSQRLVLWECA